MTSTGLCTCMYRHWNEKSCIPSYHSRCSSNVLHTVCIYTREVEIKCPQCEVIQSNLPHPPGHVVGRFSTLLLNRTPCRVEHTRQCRNRSTVVSQEFPTCSPGSSSLHKHAVPLSPLCLPLSLAPLSLLSEHPSRYTTLSRGTSTSLPLLHDRSLALENAYILTS